MEVGLPGLLPKQRWGWGWGVLVATAVLVTVGHVGGPTEVITHIIGADRGDHGVLCRAIPQWVVVVHPISLIPPRHSVVFDAAHVLDIWIMHGLALGGRVEVGQVQLWKTLLHCTILATSPRSTVLVEGGGWGHPIAHTAVLLGVSPQTRAGWGPGVGVGGKRWEEGRLLLLPPSLGSSTTTSCWSCRNTMWCEAI